VGSGTVRGICDGLISSVGTSFARLDPKPFEQGEVMIAPSSGRMLKVLVVDDNRDAAATLAILLRLWGHDVRVAFSGLEALQTAIVFRPEFMLLDVEMPIMHGGKLAETIRQLPELNRPVIVALSGTDPTDGRLDACRNLFDEYLIKPYHLQRLQHLLAGAPQRPQDEGRG
jgi:CheY-like chemotaxis protein